MDVEIVVNDSIPKGTMLLVSTPSGFHGMVNKLYEEVEVRIKESFAKQCFVVKCCNEQGVVGQIVKLETQEKYDSYMRGALKEYISNNRLLAWKFENCEKSNV